MASHFRCNAEITKSLNWTMTKTKQNKKKVKNKQLTWLRPKYVKRAATGAAIAKTNKCLRILFLSQFSCNRKLTKPNAAGACEEIVRIQEILGLSRRVGCKAIFFSYFGGQSGPGPRKQFGSGTG